MPSPKTRVVSRTADVRARIPDDPRSARLPAPQRPRLDRRTDPRDAPATPPEPADTADTAGSAGTDAELRALTLATNRTSTRTSATGGPALPLRDGVRVYLEGLPAAAASAYAQPVDDLAEAEVAVLRVAAAAGTGTTDEDTDRVLDIAAAVPTIVVLRVEGPCPTPEFADNCAALLIDLGAPDQTVLDVVFGRHAPLGRLPFPLGPAEDPEFPQDFGLTY
ncbi:hypothetical protein [Yinghuangia sp. YIM S09857]|uniref:hypothetical protein n=1 Tax=Yinghuangia sp. YIM S09857 TaxID=3436929 RepID=UPI003F537D48